MHTPDTAALDVALESAGDMEGGFAIGDVSHVDSVWSLVEADLAKFGFVLQLADGTRRMIELTFDEMIGHSNEVEVELLDLADSHALPHLDGGGVWSTDVDHLNARLAELKRQ